jgi:pyruvate dehydrogenase E1 component beta subunit
VALPDVPTPTSPALANHYYPRAVDIVAAARRMLELGDKPVVQEKIAIPLDVPDMSFKGPF